MGLTKEQIEQIKKSKEAKEKALSDNKTVKK